MEQPPAANPPPPVEPLQPSSQLGKCKLQNEGEGETQSYYDIEIPLGESAIFGDFDLEKVVCSHGLFMMAPNRWDPVNKSLIRPLRLGIPPYHGGESAVVRVSHHLASSPSSLLVRVFGVESLSAGEEEAVVVQVRRMLRLSESEEMKVREFQRVHGEAKKRGFGRVFRSPTLFEDMVKCILLCNCQWSRTLSMAKALCELQFELQHPSSKPAHGDPYTHSEAFIPPTPVGKERRKRRKLDKISRALFRAESVGAAASETDKSSKIESIESTNLTDLPEKLTPSLISSNLNFESHEQRNGCESSIEINVKTSNSPAIGNFPSPEELVGLGEQYLAKRCNVGYRAGRILNLAQAIVEGRIQLSQLEELCSEASSSSYQDIDDKLKKINGFGPFTRGNVLMCMGFYNVIPTDSETIRHLKQVHSRITTSESVQKAVEDIYGAFEPFQFLAYWSEVWNFYEEWFGKLSEMPSSDYGRITASNMKVQKFTSRRR